MKTIIIVIAVAVSGFFTIINHGAEVVSHVSDTSTTISTPFSEEFSEANSMAREGACLLGSDKSMSELLNSSGC